MKVTAFIYPLKKLFFLLDELIRRFYKFKNLFPKVFIGTIDLEELSEKSLHSSFKNVMVVTDSGKKLIQKLTEVSELSYIKFTF